MGWEFQSTLTTNLLTEHGIELSHTLPYAHWFNPVKRANQTLGNMIRTALQETRWRNHRPPSLAAWNQLLGPIMFTYNAVVHTSTNVTPSELFYRRAH